MGEVADRIRATIHGAGDPERARQQQAYMKSALPFEGLSSPELRVLLRPILAERIAVRSEWAGEALSLWDEATVREHRYAAIALLEHRYYREWHDPDLLGILRHMVVTGAWWDLVDVIASHLVGDVLARHRELVTPAMALWAEDDDMWLRRVAILCQLGDKDETDEELLSQAITANLEGSRHGSQFFIRKAIGWALRDYARTDPDWVRHFVAGRAERLSPLSRREALKHLG